MNEQRTRGLKRLDAQIESLIRCRASRRHFHALVDRCLVDADYDIDKALEALDRYERCLHLFRSGGRELPRAFQIRVHSRKWRRQPGKLESFGTWDEFLEWYCQPNDRRGTARRWCAFEGRTFGALAIETLGSADRVAKALKRVRCVVSPLVRSGKEHGSYIVFDISRRFDELEHASLWQSLRAELERKGIPVGRSTKYMPYRWLRPSHVVPAVAIHGKPLDVDRRLDWKP